MSRKDVKFVRHCEICGAEIWETGMGEIHFRMGQDGMPELSFQCFYLWDHPYILDELINIEEGIENENQK